MLGKFPAWTLLISTTTTATWCKGRLIQLCYQASPLFVSRALRTSRTLTSGCRMASSTSVGPSLVIIDLLSHQGPHDNAAALMHEALSGGLVNPSRLFFFSDLSPYRVALAAAERVIAASASLDKTLANDDGSSTESSGDRIALLSALLSGLGEYSKRGSKDFPFLAHAVRSEIGRARVASVLHHALAMHPELCATDPADSLEGLHGALEQFVRTVVAPRIAGSPTTLVMLSHGGSAMLNVRGRLDGPAIL